MLVKMKMRRCGLLILCAICGLRASEFDYEHQAKWYDQYEECSRHRQSPIELNSKEAVLATDMPSIQFVHYDSVYSTPAKSENNGHTANIVLPKSKQYSAEQWQTYDLREPHIYGGRLPEGRFIAESLHFHWGSRDAHGSEHVIDSARFTMEMHILHRNTAYRTVEEARSHADGLAVLAILFAVNSTTTGNYTGLDDVISVLEAIPHCNESVEINNFTLATLLGDLNPAEFFTYEGSLTTPPCSEAVTWVVFAQIMPISHEKMTRFHDLTDDHGIVLENNYRALQAKGDRAVYLRRAPKVANSIIESPLYWELLNKLRPTASQPLWDVAA